ncbi:MAG: hypothetical protein Q8936_02290, partial [Bacillota bacterium]|nr:hypothetical protein [Bacillota bacterium]
SWNMVSVPAKTPRILKGIKEYKENSTFGHSVNIKESKVSNRIFWLNTENGVPLYAYAPIRLYEKNYEETIFEKEGIGRHLVQTRENNWAYLPSPIPEASWGTTHLNERVKRYNNEVRELFDKAVKLGCIVDTKAMSNSVFKCIPTIAFDIDEFTSKYDLGLEEGKAPNVAEIRRCVGDLRKLLADKLSLIEHADMQKYYIFDSRDDKSAKENFIRSPKLIELIKEEVSKYEGIQGKIEELQGFLHNLDKATRVMDEFIQAMYTETICKKGVVYMYDKDVDERTDIEPFVNLMKQKQYPEFTIFNKFWELDDKYKNVVNAKSDKRLGELSMEEGTKTLYDRILTMIEIYSKSVEELDYRRYELDNGDELYSFYFNVLDKLKEIKKNVE